MPTSFGVPTSPTVFGDGQVQDQVVEPDVLELVLSGGKSEIKLGEKVEYPAVVLTVNGESVDSTITMQGVIDNTVAANQSVLIHGYVNSTGAMAEAVEWQCNVTAEPRSDQSVKFVIEGDDTVIDIHGLALTHTFQHWFVTDSDVDSGDKLNILASGSGLAVDKGIGELECVGPFADEVYTLVALTKSEGVSHPVLYRRFTLRAKAV